MANESNTLLHTIKGAIPANVVAEGIAGDNNKYIKAGTLLGMITANNTYNVYKNENGEIKDSEENEYTVPTFIFHVADIGVPVISAINFAGEDGVGLSNSWLIDISGVINEDLLNTGSITVSEDCTLQSKTVDGVDVSSWCNPVSLVEGENITEGIKTLLGFDEDITFDVLHAQDIDEDGYLIVIVELKDASDNKTNVTIKIKIDAEASPMVTLTANINGIDVTSYTGELSCEVEDTISYIKMELSESVTIEGTPLVLIDGTEIYGTLSLDPEDSTGKTLLMTPYLGNETAELVGDFTFSVESDVIDGRDTAMGILLNDIPSISDGQKINITMLIKGCFIKEMLTGYDTNALTDLNGREVTIDANKTLIII